jgi:hypothetical protein
MYIRTDGEVVASVVTVTMYDPITSQESFFVVFFLFLRTIF